MEEGKDLIQDASPASIRWTQSLANRARLSAHVTRFRASTHEGRGAPRAGAAFLQGLATCGRCGRPMHVAYRRHPRDVCTGMRRAYAQPPCAPLGRPSIETFVGEA